MLCFERKPRFLNDGGGLRGRKARITYKATVNDSVKTVNFFTHVHVSTFEARRFVSNMAEH